MVAPAIAAAGIGAVGSVLGGITGGKGAKKAAKAQAKATAAQIAAAEQNRNYQYQLNEPTINRGEGASSIIAGLLGVGGGDPAAANAGFDAYRDSGGYQFRLGEGTKAINTNAYARGMGDSGATLKALTRYGQDYGSAERDRYIQQLGGLSGEATAARGLVAGVGGNFVNQFANANQANADAQGNAALVQGNLWASALNNIGQAGAYALGSSYKQPGSLGGGFAPVSQAGYPVMPTPYGYIPGGFGGRT